MLKMYFVKDRLFTIDYAHDAGLYSVDYGNGRDQLMYRGPEHAHRLVLEQAIKQLVKEGILVEEVGQISWRSYREVGATDSMTH